VTAQRDLLRLGVTGHQELPSAALSSVAASIRSAVAQAERGLIGVTSLAAGSDQLFAQEVLAAGGRLHAVIPCERYEKTFAPPDRETYRELLEQAAFRETLPFAEPSELAYYSAGRRVVDLCEQLLAVWDGQPARGFGGTADVVAYACERARDVKVLWPPGITR
jgi:hypothetical protein